MSRICWRESSKYGLAMTFTFPEEEEEEDDDDDEAPLSGWQKRL